MNMLFKQFSMLFCGGLVGRVFHGYAGPCQTVERVEERPFLLSHWLRSREVKCDPQSETSNDQQLLDSQVTGRSEDEPDPSECVCVCVYVCVCMSV